MRAHVTDIEFVFEHADADGSMIETLINVAYNYHPGWRGDRTEPPESAEIEYLRASFRDGNGVWRPIATGEWLDIWAQARLAEVDPAEFEDRAPCGRYPEIAE